MWRYLLPAVVFAALLAFFVKGLNLNPSYVPSPLIGKPLPAFTLPTLKDPETQVSDQDILGQVSLVNVWATWCVGCRQEHGFLVELARRGEVPIYGLNWKDDRAAALKWLTDLGDPYQFSGFDAEGRVAIDWGVYGAPETFLVGADGEVLYKHLSPMTAQVWESEFLPRIEALKP